MQRVESRMDIRNKRLGRKGSEECLRRGAKVRGDLRALPDSDLHGNRHYF
jgi:hypothetical protein